MARSGKAALRVLAVCALTPLGLGVTGLAIADSFDFEGIEVQEQFGEAIVTLDAPPGSDVEHAVDEDSGEMTVTFTGTSIRLPRRVYSGEGTLKSVDLEPWFADGERLTRMVLKYEVGSDAWMDQEGDVLMLSVTDPDAGIDAAEDHASAPSDEMQAGDSATDEAGTMDAEAEVVGDAVVGSELAFVPVDAAQSTASPSVGTDVADPEPVVSDEAEAEAGSDAPAADDELASTPSTGDEPESTPSADDEPESTPSSDDASSDWSMWGEPDSVSDDGMLPTGPVAMTDTPPASGTAEPEWEDEVVYASSSRQGEPASPEPMSELSDDPADMAEMMVASPSDDGAEPTRRHTPAKSHTFLTTDAPADAQPQVPVDMEADPRISIDLQGAEIHTVLRSIAETSGHDIVANAGVQGTVTLRLNDVPWRRALQIILRTQGLDYVEELGVIRVAKADVLRAEEIERESAYRKKDGLVPLATQLVPVEFATASELVASVTGMLSPRGKLEVDERTNTIIVTDIPSVLPAVDGLVRKLDSRTPQVEIVAELVDMDAGAARELGIQWGAENLHSTSLSASANASVDAGIARSVGTINFGVIQDWVDLNLTLQALEQTNKANIISNPRISTVNNREARILVGQEIPLVVQDEAGNAITELKKIGIELRVTPYINQGSSITLDLHPQVSDLASQASDASGIIINTSEADTRVMVRDGETVAIGGMIRQNETETERRVPVLGSLPIVGGVFRSTSTTESKRELIIFVTPRIVE